MPLASLQPRSVSGVLLDRQSRVDMARMMDFLPVPLDFREAEELACFQDAVWLRLADRT